MLSLVTSIWFTSTLNTFHWTEKTWIDDWNMQWQVESLSIFSSRCLIMLQIPLDTVCIDTDYVIKFQKRHYYSENIVWLTSMCYLHPLRNLPCLPYYDLCEEVIIYLQLNFNSQILIIIYCKHFAWYLSVGVRNP